MSAYIEKEFNSQLASDPNEEGEKKERVNR